MFDVGGLLWTVLMKLSNKSPGKGRKGNVVTNLTWCCGTWPVLNLWYKKYFVTDIQLLPTGHAFHFTSASDIFKQFFGTDDPFADFLADFGTPFGEHIIITRSPSESSSLLMRLYM